MKLERDFERV